MRAGWLAMIAGCGTSATPELGLDQRLQITGAQYRPGPLPTPDGGPDALILRSLHVNVTVGQVRERITGVLGAAARSAVVGLDGVDGGWLVAAGAPSFEMPDNPTLSATIGLADDFPAGPFTLLVFGGDAEARAARRRART